MVGIHNILCRTVTDSSSQLSVIGGAGGADAVGRQASEPAYGRLRMVETDSLRMVERLLSVAQVIER